MEGVRLEDRGPDGSSSIDLRDILAVLGEDARRSVWRIVRVECIGDQAAAAALQRASGIETFEIVDGARLVELTTQASRVVAGNFLGRFPDEDDFWIMIRALDGGGYDVRCDREDVITALKNRFARVSAIPSSAVRELTMRSTDLEDQLCQVATEDTDHMEFHSYRIVEELTKSGAGLGAVRTILRFMEENADLDFGMPPSPLATFAGRFIGAGFEEELFASLSRRPTMPTVSMLNALINVAETIGEQAKLILVLEELRNHPAADEGIQEQIDFYLERFRS